MEISKYFFLNLFKFVYEDFEILSPATLLRKSLWYRCFPFCKISKSTFFYRTPPVAVSIHERNVQILATEMYKVSNNFSNLHMNKIFEASWPFL